MQDTLDGIIAAHSRQLARNQALLHEIMPEYFFKSFSPEQIGTLLPLMLNLAGDSIPRQSEIDRKIFRVYLKSAGNNILNSARSMVDFHFTGAVIHESSKPYVLDGENHTLVIESFSLTDDVRAVPRFTADEIAADFRRRSGGVPDGLAELCARLNWAQLGDLTLDRLAERIELALEVQGRARAALSLQPFGDGRYRLLLAAPNAGDSCRFFGRLTELFTLFDFHLERAYWREFSQSAGVEELERQPVVLGAFYFDGDSARFPEFERAAKALYWTGNDDLFHRELVVRRRFNPADANLFRAGAEFLHSQFAFVDRNAYTYADIERLLVLYPELDALLLDAFRRRFDPDAGPEPADGLRERIEAEIDAINSGVADRDLLAHNIFRGMLNFLDNLEKTNFFVIDKGALAFRLKPDFMQFFAALSPEYLKSFPADPPFGVFFFYRRRAAGYQVRFSEIARGGWRTVIPRLGSNELEQSDYYDDARNEFFREVYVLAHTQHMKNKDIFEGGSKMITLLRTAEGDQVKPVLWEAQKAILDAFLSLINYTPDGVLRDPRIRDRHGRKEIVEIGPDENMFDPMIRYMGDYAERLGYTLGAGLISGKPDRGINHKEFGVTSFGVHEFLLRTMRELGIDPRSDDYSIKISGGPFGDVAGNLMKLLLRREDGGWRYPRQRITAITDGPAAVYDPDGIDRDELAGLVLKRNLDAFDPQRLHGEGAYIVYSRPLTENGDEFHRQLIRVGGQLEEKRLTRDEFMRIFQSNLYHYADLFVPCGGRPSTIGVENCEHFMTRDGAGCRAIVEGANSFITPAARIRLQESGILNVKDASANKCGVITSSYEILSGLMLDEAEFKAAKAELVPQVMEKLAFNARREAEWLFSTRAMTGRMLTELTERLSRHINAKNAQIFAWLDDHPEQVTDEIILAHLPRLFRDRFRDRLSRIPAEYRKAIVSVELATRIIYNSANGLENEIAQAVRDLC